MQNFYKYFIFVVHFILLFSLCGFCQLNGINTINPSLPNFSGNPAGVSGKNYSSFNSAVTALTAFGVNSAVTFNVSAGTYNEQITIGNITGVLSTKTITFQSVTLDSNSVILTYSASGPSNNWVVNINGGRYITFRFITIKATNPNYGMAVVLKSGAIKNTFRRNVIRGNGTTVNSAGVYSNTGSQCNNTFENNLITGGYYGIYFGTAYGWGNIARSNIINGFYYTGIYCNSQDSLEINKNTITGMPGSAPLIYGIYCVSVNNASKIINNKVMLNTSKDMYGIYLTGTSGTAAISLYVANNFISLNGGNSGVVYGLYSVNSSYQKIYYNSINLTNTTTLANSALYLSSSSSSYKYINVLNNILDNNGNGYAIYFDANAVLYGMVSSCNYNDLYSAGINLGHYGSSDVVSLAAWQLKSGKDASSISVVPPFVSATNLHLTNYKALKITNPLSDMPTDIDGEQRSLSSPVAGADDYPGFAINAAISSIASPQKYICEGVYAIVAYLDNMGSDYLDSVHIDYSRNGVLKKTVLYTGHLKELDETFVFICNDTFYAGNHYNVVVKTRRPNGKNDQWPYDDADSVHNIQVYKLPVINKVTNDTACWNTNAVLKVSSNNAHRYYWYDSLKATGPFAEDSILALNNLTANHVYYTEAVTPGYYYSLNTSKSIVASEMGNMFNVKAISDDIVIDSFAINSNVVSNTPVAIAVYYKKGSYKGYETNSSAWKLAGIDTVISRGAALNTNVPIGHIRIIKDDTVGIYMTTTDTAQLLNYMDGANIYQDANIRVSTGTKNLYRFSSVFQSNKTFVGTIYYSTSPLCVSSRVPVYAIALPVPKLELGKDTDICHGHGILLDAGYGQGYSYVWKYGNRQDTFSVKQAILIDSNGKYKVILADKCSNLLKDSINITVRPKPLAFFEVSDTNQCLKGNNFVFSNYSFVPGGTITNNTWLFGDGAINHNINCYHTYVKDDTFNVWLYVISDHLCRDSLILPVIVYPQPKVAFSVQDSVQCLIGNLFNFTNSSSIKNGTMSFSWNGGDGSFSGSNNFSHSYLSPGNYLPSLIVTSGFNCSDSVALSIRVKPNPVINLGKDTVLLANQSITLDAGAGYDNYIWSTGNYASKIRVDSSKIGLHSKNFWVHATKDGCSGGDTIKITFIKPQSVEGQGNNFSIRIFPNPASTILNIMIEGTDNKTMILLNNMQDEEIYCTSVNCNKGKMMKQIDISALPSGIYFLKIYNESNMKIVKIIKN